jgi:hypothetical protein
MSAQLVERRRAWKAPRCSHCKLRLFRSQHTGVIYTELDRIHEHEPTKAERAEWDASWAEGDRLSPKAAP